MVHPYVNCHDRTLLLFGNDIVSWRALRRHLMPDCWFTPEDNKNGCCGVRSGSKNVFSSFSCSRFFLVSATSSPSADQCLLSGISSSVIVFCGLLVSAACTMMKFHCLLWPMKCLAWMCCPQSWLLYSPSSQNHMDISHLALLRGKGFYCLALLFEHDDVPNDGRLQ